MIRHGDAEGSPAGADRSCRAGRSARTRSSGTNTSSTTIFAAPRRTCPTCPQLSTRRAPGSLSWHRHVERAGATLGSSNGNIVDIAMPTGPWLAENLIARTSGPRRPAPLAAGVGEVGAAGGDEHDAVVRRRRTQRSFGTGQTRRWRHAVNAVTCWCMAGQGRSNHRVPAELLLHRSDLGIAWTHRLPPSFDSVARPQASRPSRQARRRPRRRALASRSWRSACC